MTAYISEVDLGGSNRFVEIAVPKGTDMSGYSIVVYNGSGNVIQTLPYGSAVATMGGHDVYVIDAGDGLHNFQNGQEYALALVGNGGSVEQFISFNDTINANNGPAAGQTSTHVWGSGGGNFPSGSLETADDGSSYYVQSSPNAGTVPCYAPGTLIDTPDGPRAVETLRIGDLVETLDHGPMPIRWVRSGDQPLDGVGYDGRPVMIRAGAFGAGCPARDLVVSPQHRILVGAAGQLDGIFGAQYFAPAEALTGLPFIRAMMGVRSDVWVHFALETHEVVWANGCLSESLLLGPMVLNGMTALQRREVTALFGEAAEGEALNGPVARDCLKVKDLQRTIDRLDRSSKAVVRAA